MTAMMATVAMTIRLVGDDGVAGFCCEVEVTLPSYEGSL
jgi:hypothetical protein